MTVHTEVWPVSVDEGGIWLVSGSDAWRPALPVMADGEPHADIDLELARHDVLDDVVLAHSTSWRLDGPALLLTYVVALRSDGPVHQRWPEATMVDLRFARAAGKPYPHGAATPPNPRPVDAMLHALRHLRFLLDTDATVRRVLGQQWRRHLTTLTPALAGMYDGTPRVPAQLDTADAADADRTDSLVELPAVPG